MAFSEDIIFGAKRVALRWGLWCRPASPAPRWTLLGTSMIQGWGTWMKTPSVPVPLLGMNSSSNNNNSNSSSNNHSSNHSSHSHHRQQQQQQPPSIFRDPRCNLSLLSCSSSSSRHHRPQRIPCLSLSNSRASRSTLACCTPLPLPSGPPLRPTPPPSSTLPPGKAASSISMTTCLATLQVPQPQVGREEAAGTDRPAP